MFYYPVYLYLEFGLISLGLAIGVGVLMLGIGWVLRPKAGVEG